MCGIFHRFSTVCNGHRQGTALNHQGVIFIRPILPNPVKTPLTEKGDYPLMVLEGYWGFL